MLVLLSLHVALTWLHVRKQSALTELFSIRFVASQMQALELLLTLLFADDFLLNLLMSSKKIQSTFIFVKQRQRTLVNNTLDNTCLIGPFFKYFVYCCVHQEDLYCLWRNMRGCALRFVKILSKLYLYLQSGLEFFN